VAYPAPRIPHAPRSGAQAAAQGGQCHEGFRAAQKPPPRTYTRVTATVIRFPCVSRQKRRAGGGQVCSRPGGRRGGGAERAAHVIFSAPSAQVSLTWGADALALRISRRYAFLGVSTKVLYAGALLVPGPALHGDIWQDCGLCMASCSGLGAAEER
jgi:hypothetical protein